MQGKYLTNILFGMVFVLLERLADLDLPEVRSFIANPCQILPPGDRLSFYNTQPDEGEFIFGDPEVARREEGIFNVLVVNFRP